MNIKKWKIISILFSLVIGTLLHFTYEWSGKNGLVGLFSAVNESTWEHLKLVFFPMFLIGIIGYFKFRKEYKNYIKAVCLGIILAMSFITIFFYTYTGIIGKNFALIDILSFVAAVILGECLTYKVLKNGKNSNEKIYLLILVILAIYFFIFTYNPLHIAYFKDPITNTYGISD